MKKRIRVLIAEDSATSRELIRSILKTDPRIEVVGEAVDGIQAVNLARDLSPDVITMDIRMPRMDGFEATKKIMSESPTRIVIVSGQARGDTLNECMCALRFGALALLSKPTGPGAADFAKTSIQLLKTVKALSDVEVIRRRHRPLSLAGKTPATDPAEKSSGAYGMVAIAASTGGPPALLSILSKLSPDFPLPILVVQHLGVGFVEGFVKWLNFESPLPVCLARHREPLLPGTIYIAPDDCHLGVATSGAISLSDDPPIMGFKPSASFLFRSAAEIYGRRALAVVLTGMGQDGVDGLREVHRRGGTVLAQDEASSVVWGMPGAAVAEKVVRQVVPLEHIAQTLVEEVSWEEETYGKARTHRRG